MKVLIVDDSPVMRAMIKRALKKGGIEAETFEAGDGQQAIDQMPKMPDVILCDWNMPTMNGLQFLRLIRQNGDDTPFLMVTTESHSAKRLEASTAGADGFISKPFTPEDLAIHIRETVAL